MPGDSSAGALSTAGHLELDGLTKTFGTVTAVEEVSFSVGEGEFLTLLGPSGSGKTTLLRMLGGFEYPTRGRILLHGQDVAFLPPYRRNIGMVFQKYALFPHMTVFENVAFPLKRRGLSRADVGTRVADALAMVSLTGFEERQPRQLSGGQQQRVALARAFVFHPEMLLMDEPLGALDKQLREHMQREIRALQQRIGITTVYVTHDQTEAMTMSDRVAVMNGGRIEQIGSPEELYERPRTEFVARFVGDSNLLEVDCVGLEDGKALLRLPGGGTVRCVVTERPSLDKSRLLIRPEKLRIQADELPDPGSARNSVRGRLESVTYLGDSNVYEVSLGDSKVTVKQPNRAGESEPRTGEIVTLTWSAADCSLIC